jgi:hypothetical protein
MPDYTATVNLPDHKLGDRWVGIAQIGPVTINGATPTAPLTRIRMQFRQGSLLYTLDSDSEASDADAEIDLDNAATWQASIPEVDEFLSASGLWSYDIEFYDDDHESPLTLYQGTINVHPHITLPEVST